MKILKYSFLLIAGILISSLSFSQVTLILSSLETCPGNFEVPIEAQNFNDIASVSLKINYDSSVITYDGYTNLNTAFNTGLFLINDTHKQVIFSWFSLNPVSLGNTILITLNFHHLLNINTTLSWDDDSLGNCVLTDINGIELITVLTDATITTAFKPPVPITPVNNATGIAETPVLHWNGSGCGPHYSLMYSTQADFLSDTTVIENIFGTNYQVDSLVYNTKYYWKIKAVINSTPYYTTWSDIFCFTIKDVDGVAENPGSIINFKLTPNPASDKTLLFYELKQAATVNINLISISSHEVQQIENEAQMPGTHTRELDIKNLSPGTYFIRIIASTPLHSITTSRKLLINK